MTEIYRIDIEITAPVRDTEVTARVADAISNLFPSATIEEGHGELRAETHSLDRLSELLHQQEILDTARSVFFENHSGTTFSFRLKKQAAFQERINFTVGESDELGEIAVRVRVDEPNVEAYIDHVAPPTEDGRPIDANDAHPSG